MATTNDIRKAFLKIQEVSGHEGSFEEDPVFYTDISQMFYAVEDNSESWSDAAPQIIDFYAKVADFIDNASLPPTDEILKFISDHDIPKTIILCIALRKQGESENLYNALFKISKGEEREAPWVPLQTMTLTYNASPEEVEDGLPIVNGDLSEDSETIDLEYNMTPLMDSKYAKGMRNWTSGVSENVVERFKNIDIQTYGMCAKKNDPFPQRPFNLKINRSCRKIDTSGIVTHPKMRIHAINKIINQTLAEIFHKGSFFQFLKTHYDNNITVRNEPNVIINFDTVDVRSVLTKLWSDILTEETPLNVREFTIRSLDKQKIVNVLKDVFSILIDSYGIDDVIEKNTSVISLTIGFTDILCFEMASKLHLAANQSIFYMVPPDRVSALLSILKKALNETINQINEGNVNRPLYIPEKIIRLKAQRI